MSEQRTGRDAAVELLAAAFRPDRDSNPDLPDAEDLNCVAAAGDSWRPVTVGEIADTLLTAGWQPPTEPAQGSVYVHLRDADVDRTECITASINIDRDANGGLVGVEVLGSIRVVVDGKPVTSNQGVINELPAPYGLDLPTTTPEEDPVGSLRIATDHLYVKLAEPDDEPWHLVYCPGQQNMSGWQSNECMEGTVPAGRIPVELAVPEPGSDVVEAVARAIHESRKPLDTCRGHWHTWEAHTAEAAAAILAHYAAHDTPYVNEQHKGGNLLDAHMKLAAENRKLVVDVEFLTASSSLYAEQMAILRNHLGLPDGEGVTVADMIDAMPKPGALPEQAKELAHVTVENGRLKAALADALEGLEDMLPYVSEYFAEKWNHAGYIQRAKEALHAAGIPVQDGDQP
ncbi:DUF2283 domain-containing protein [Kutzneria albida]|uniref:Uncharacterized protein n=1 Tax=Kutzneria albida DSM 43870 TaxID=1449976 RepID=W5WBY6_9PSEU|nr:DUF2283 domain-containing protein [Kutzneria albida]AHH98265.1 hypothetical protein KALB_4903 [Kutzneria albida DSM 43870]